MPIFFQQDIDNSTRLAIWRIEEDEDFFLRSVPLQKEITHPHKRLQHLAGRFLLKQLFPDFPVELIRIADTRKPFLENESYHFSISHCDDYAAAIVSKTDRVGIDVEVPSSRIERIKCRFLHTEELEIAADGPEPQTANPKLTLMWCGKEAVFKWWSFGGVDFSEHIRFQPFGLASVGNLPIRFLLGDQNALTLHYRLFDWLCLAWLKT